MPPFLPTKFYHRQAGDGKRRTKGGEGMRKWLADIRTACKKSQQEVADAAGISQSYYAGIELGIRGKPLAVPVAKKIAAVLEFDWTQFYDDDEDRSPPGSVRDSA